MCLTGMAVCTTASVHAVMNHVLILQHSDPPRCSSYEAVPSELHKQPIPRLRIMYGQHCADVCAFQGSKAPPLMNN